MKYKKLYQDAVEKIKSLRSNCIDLRNMKSGKQLNFSKLKWIIVEDNSDRIIIEKL